MHITFIIFISYLLYFLNPKLIQHKESFALFYDAIINNN